MGSGRACPRYPSRLDDGPPFSPSMSHCPRRHELVGCTTGRRGDAEMRRRPPSCPRQTTSACGVGPPIEGDRASVRKRAPDVRHVFGAIRPRWMARHYRVDKPRTRWESAGLECVATTTRRRSARRTYAFIPEGSPRPREERDRYESRAGEEGGSVVFTLLEREQGGFSECMERSAAPFAFALRLHCERACPSFSPGSLIRPGRDRSPSFSPPALRSIRRGDADPTGRRCGDLLMVNSPPSPACGASRARVHGRFSVETADFAHRKANDRDGKRGARVPVMIRAVAERSSAVAADGRG